MEATKRPRDPGGEVEVEEIQRAPVFKKPGRQKPEVLVSRDAKRIKVLSPNQDIEIDILYEKDGGVAVTLSARSKLILIKSKDSLEAHEHQLVLRASHRAQRKLFTFMLLPRELRDMIYHLLVDVDSDTMTQVSDRCWVRSLRIAGMAIPSRWNVGTARNILGVSTQVRSEMAETLIKLKSFRFSSLNNAHASLKLMGKRGRECIRNMHITWWHSRWQHPRDRDQAANMDEAAQVVDIIKEIQKLKCLSIKLPRGKRLASTVFPARLFATHCGLSLLRSINHVDKVRLVLNFENKLLDDWLWDGINALGNVTRIGGRDPDDSDHYYR